MSNSCLDGIFSTRNVTEFPWRLDIEARFGVSGSEQLELNSCCEKLGDFHINQGNYLS